jgi:hypothetical protein
MVALSEDHPRIVALEYAVQFLGKLLSAQDNADYVGALRTTATQFTEHSGTGSAERGLLAIDIAGALERLADNAQAR